MSKYLAAVAICSYDNFEAKNQSSVHSILSPHFLEKKPLRPPLDAGCVELRGIPRPPTGCFGTYGAGSFGPLYQFTREPCEIVFTTTGLML